jgi:hypothetical protein
MRVRAAPYRRSSRRPSTMGSSLSRSVKAVRSDGNGNVEAVVVLAPGDPPAPRMPVSVELLCDRPSDPR